jgi:O-acetyl-ADP-ribose deacetylase (regulator of RNase III)
MINYINGDVTTTKDKLLLHGTNCMGGFGSGVAGAIRRRWPAVYDTFKTYPTGAEMLGTFIPFTVTADLIIGNCFTQHFMGSDGKKYASVDAVRASLTIAFGFATLSNIKAISMPKIGAGLGGLNWDDDILPIVTELSEQYDDITINIYYID